MSEKYFIINSSEGDVTVAVVDKTELERRLNSDGGWYRDVLSLDGINERSSHDLTASGGTVIIKGALIVPKPVKVVEKLEVD